MTEQTTTEQPGIDAQLHTAWLLVTDYAMITASQRATIIGAIETALTVIAHQRHQLTQLDRRRLTELDDTQRAEAQLDDAWAVLPTPAPNEPHGTLAGRIRDLTAQRDQARALAADFGDVLDERDRLRGPTGPRPGPTPARPTPGRHRQPLDVTTDAVRATWDRW